MMSARAADIVDVARRSLARRATTFRRACLGVACAAALAAAGCNILAPAYFLIEGPPTIPAVAELEPDRPTVVFIDDRGLGDQMIIPKRSLRQDIGRVATQAMLDRGVVEEGMMIRSEDALRLASTESANNPMSVVDVGRAVGAEVIVYVDMRGFALSRDGSTVSPASAARVKIFDAEANTQLWPEGGESHELIVQMPRQPEELRQLDRSDVRSAQQALAAFTGQRIAQMFFEIERPSRLGTSER